MTENWVSLSRNRLGPDVLVGEPIIPPACERCGKTEPDKYGPMIEADGTAWHMTCAADFAHEQERDRDRNDG